MWGSLPGFLTGKWNHRYPFYFQGWQDQWEAGERDSWIRQKTRPQYSSTIFCISVSSASWQVHFSDAPAADVRYKGCMPGSWKGKSKSYAKCRKTGKESVRYEDGCGTRPVPGAQKSGPGRGKPVKEMADNSQT